MLRPMLKYAQISSIGGRAEQQDAAGVRSSGDVLMVIICDGLGGHTGGEQASRAAVETALGTFESNPVIAPEILVSCLSAAHSRVQSLQQEAPEFGSMRTTAVALVTDGGKAIWAHVGDSRLYHFRSGQLVSQTRDHSVPQRLAEAGEIERVAIRFHEDRNRLLRALGSSGELKATVSEEIAVETGDAFLLCTDGFWEWVTEEEMCGASDADPKTWLDALEANLRTKATGEFDNYSAVTVVLAKP
jgi:serine/threonine protein phosphatase PrpC